MCWLLTGSGCCCSTHGTSIHLPSVKLYLLYKNEFSFIWFLMKQMKALKIIWENVQHYTDEWTKNIWGIWEFKWFKYADRLPQTEIWESLLIHYSFLTISLNTLRSLCQYIITELNPAEAAFFFFLFFLYCYSCFHRIYSRRVFSNLQE